MTSPDEPLDAIRSNVDKLFNEIKRIIQQPDCRIDPYSIVPRIGEDIKVTVITSRGLSERDIKALSSQGINVVAVQLADRDVSVTFARLGSAQVDSDPINLKTSCLPLVERGE